MPDPLQQYPFERVWVDHLVHGVTRVWWRHHPNFMPAGDVVYQLQMGFTGNGNAADWKNVGSPVTNAIVLQDESSRLQGKKNRVHYRVLISGAGGAGVSLPVGTWGLLDDRDWLMAREVLRQHELSHRLTTSRGFLLKRMRRGSVDKNAVNPLTGAVLDSRRTQTFGSEFEIGYYPPLTCACMDLTPHVIEEDISENGPVRPATVKGVASAFPQIDYEDVWVDDRSDMRWSVQRVTNIVEVRSVPIIVEAILNLLPDTHVAYKIPVDAYSSMPDRVTRRGPTQLSNPVVIDHNFGSTDALTYTDTKGTGVLGAKILLFTKAAYDSGLRGEVSAIAVGQTGAAGRWMTQFRVDPGPYVLVFEKAGECGPDAHDLIVQAP